MFNENKTHNIPGFAEMKFVRLLNSHPFRKPKENDLYNKNYTNFKAKSNVCKIKEKLIYTAEISDMDQPSADASLQTSAL